MRPVHFIGLPLVVGVTALASCGLQPRAERPVMVRVIDGDTGRPAAGVPVTAFYRKGLLNFTAPRPDTAVTDADGLATLGVTAYDWAELRPAFDPARYSTREFRVSRDAVRGLPDRPPAEPVHTFRVYTAPEATVELLLPADFRGMVRLRFEVTDEPAHGRRRFQFPVAPTGHVTVRGPALVTDPAFSPGVTARRFADDSPLPTGFAPEAVQLRSIAGGDGTRLFVVGTAADEAAVHDLIYPQKPPGSNTRHFDQAAYDRLFAP